MSELCPAREMEKAGLLPLFWNFWKLEMLGNSAKVRKRSKFS